jgi:hypothetical protein
VGAIILSITAIVFLSACSSPETRRSRGAGPGADVGNREKVVRMHEGADPFANTPKIIRFQGPSLDGARQAERLSRQ